VTLVPASQGRRIARRSASTSPPHTPYAPTPNACRSDSSRQSGRTPLQQALLRIIRERSAKLMLDVSGVSFMDCAGLRALLATRRRAEMRGGCMRLIATSAAGRRITELTGTHEALAAERSTTARSVQFS
jgi:anti-anti-sigma factor